MTIREMEQRIDLLNLSKIEVKMRKGGQVDYFVCRDPESREPEGRVNVIVFDSVGRAWVRPRVLLRAGQMWNIWRVAGSVYLNGVKMQRIPVLDL